MTDAIFFWLAYSEYRSPGLRSAPLWTASPSQVGSPPHLRQIWQGWRELYLGALSPLLAEGGDSENGHWSKNSSFGRSYCRAGWWHPLLYPYPAQNMYISQTRKCVFSGGGLPWKRMLLLCLDLYSYGRIQDISGTSNSLVLLGLV